MKQHYFTITILTLLNTVIFAQDWKDIPVPAQLENGLTWKLHPQSDDFNYTAPANNKGAEFSKKWNDGYHNEWKGPGLTEWSPANTSVKDGLLTMTANRNQKSYKIELGCITSKSKIKYPVFLEAKVKISNSLLASNVWMLSTDDSQEIDILEAYGSTNEKNKWFSERLHLSHHMFNRTPFEDYQPTDNGSWYGEEGKTSWYDEFIRVGVYWKDPYTLEYYVNGKLARKTEGLEMIDPRKFSGEEGIHKEMNIIINAEDQQWRLDKGLTPSNDDLKNTENNTYLIDWIRIYTPNKVIKQNPEIAKYSSKMRPSFAEASTKIIQEAIDSEAYDDGTSKKETIDNEAYDDGTSKKETVDDEAYDDGTSKPKEAATSYTTFRKTTTSPYIDVTLSEKEPNKILSFKATNNVKKILIIDQTGKVVSNKKYDLDAGFIVVDKLVDGYYILKFKSDRGGVLDYIYRKKSK